MSSFISSLWFISYSLFFFLFFLFPAGCTGKSVFPFTPYICESCVQFISVFNFGKLCITEWKATNKWPELRPSSNTRLRERQLYHYNLTLSTRQRQNLTRGKTNHLEFRFGRISQGLV